MKNKEIKKIYYIGLDIGSGSVGFAITDPAYNVININNKDLWGTVIFDMAETAKECRLFRCGRRMRKRKKERISTLQEFFAEAINEVDPGFYIRMKESRYYHEDKKDVNGNCPLLPYTLFADENFTDKDFYEKYPTIYHLRLACMEENITDDRLIYLALHHIFKKRGHFYLNGSIEDVKNFDTTFDMFLNTIKDEELDFSLEFDEEARKDLSDILKDRTLSKSKKKECLIKRFGAKTKCEKAILGMIVGCTANLKDIFADIELAEDNKIKICFTEAKYEENVPILEDLLNDQFCVVEVSKAMYDWSALVEILKDTDSISKAKIMSYEKHKYDLKYLKDLVLKYLTKEEYNHIFNETEKELDNYVAYIGSLKKHGKKVQLETKKKCSKDDFYKFLKKNVLRKINDKEATLYLEEELEKETFLPKQTDNENCLIPYQVQLYELTKILENLSDNPTIKKYKNEILQLFTFRIPYYVGPLKGDKFSWVVRNSNEKVYPWNFEEVVDVEKSAEKFIRRMTNKCSYLYGEDVIPKFSLLYSKFTVLNELNNLRLDGEKISVELKQKIYEDLFCKYKKVTQDKLKKYLVLEGAADKKVEITGIDKEFKSSLKSYHDFEEKLSDANLNEEEKEDIILDVSLFNADPKLLRKRMEMKYPHLTDKQVKIICSLPYKGWGRLSKAFLEELKTPDPETGEVWNIMDGLWNTNNNLMMLLSKEYGFMNELNKINHKEEEFTWEYNELEDLYLSPSTKRQVWQTLRVVKEAIKIMGCPPKRIFIEVAKGNDGTPKGQSTESRQSWLEKLYKDIKDKNTAKEIKSYKNGELRNRKLFLYYTQKGYCMYTGEKIPLDAVLSGSALYDIDHIYPQSKTTDNSISNMVLVKKNYNSNKSNDFPVKKSIQDKMTPFWQQLVEEGFITKEKYHRLTRTDRFSDNELTGFISRQIVENRQSTKVIADLLKRACPGTEIVYVKAEHVSKFRQDFMYLDKEEKIIDHSFVKVREMNDFHHAKDAYLNIVVGNTYYTKFTKDAAWYVKNHPYNSYSLKSMFTGDYDVARNGEVAWKAGKEGTIVTVRKRMTKNNILVTRKPFDEKGKLFDLQPLKKGKGQMPLKKTDDRISDIQKYGGYNNVSGSYFMLVKSKNKKGEELRTLEAVPLHLKDKFEESNDFALEYFKTREEDPLKDPEILISKIKKDTLFKINGFPLYISGRSKKRCIFKCGVQLLLPPEETLTLKKVLKFIERRGTGKKKTDLKIVPKDNITEEMLLKLYDAFEHKANHTIYNIVLSNLGKKLTQKRDEFIKLSAEDKSEFLYILLNSFQCNSAKSDLKNYGYSTSEGIIYLNKDISKCEQVSIIYQSITQFFTKEVDLKKL